MVVLREIAEPSGAKGVGYFVQGAANFLTPLGVPKHAAMVVVAVLVISFAATSLDTGVRIQRFILAELGVENRYLGGGIAVGLPLLLYLAGKDRTLWPLFGASNQMLAGLSLIVVTVWLYRKGKGKAWLFAAIPMVIVLVVAAAALNHQVFAFYRAGNYLLVGVGVSLLVLELWIVIEGIMAVRRSGATEQAA